MRCFSSPSSTTRDATRAAPCARSIASSRDYPDSPVRASAALWGARAAFDVRDRDRACRWSELGSRPLGGDVELGASSNSSASVAAPWFARGIDCHARLAPSKPAPPAKGWQVQVAAVKTRGEADVEVGAGQAARAARAGGPGGRLAQGPERSLHDSRSSAEAAMARIREQLGGKPFLVAPKPSHECASQRVSEAVCACIISRLATRDSD